MGSGKGRKVVDSRAFDIMPGAVESGNTTRELYTDDGGNWTAERQVLHEQIIKHFMDSAKGNDKVAIFLGGGSASGKSTMRRDVVEPMLGEKGLQPASVDSDDIKGMLPEFEPFKTHSVDTAAGRVHDESSYLSTQIIGRLIEKGKPFIYDGTMSSPKKYIALTNRLKAAGYIIKAYVADVPVKNALTWAQRRADKIGRKVPTDIIINTHKNVYNTFNAIKDQLDHYEVHRNPALDGGKHGMIASKDRGIIDQEQYHAFTQKEYERID